MFQKMLVFFVFFVQFVRAENGCILDLFTMWNPPLVLSSQLEILYPSLTNPVDNRNLTIPTGTTILLSCNGVRFNEPFKNTKTIQATCDRDNKFEVQDQIIDFNTIGCAYNDNPVTPKITPGSCTSTNSQLIEIGFEIGLNIDFLPQLRICFDLEKLTTLYSQVNLTKSIGFIKSYLTQLYEVDSVFNTINFDLNFLYDNLTFQQQQFNELLDLEADSTEYVNLESCHPTILGVPTTPGFCFAKRPLTYRGDFVYISQQAATYRYINVVPQWSFLDYNLDKLERNVIDFVKSRQIDLEVYSGTFGVATFPNSKTGKQTEIYFHSEQDRQFIPLPLYFWKLIYDGVSQNATVFVTVNNPHLKSDEISKFVFCQDVSEQIDWLTWNSKNLTFGYSYACTYHDAKDVINYLPYKKVNGLLH